MNIHPMQRASIPNPLLKPFSALIGEWITTGTHRLVPDTILHGRTSFEWVGNGAFLMTRSEIDDARFPAGIAIIGSDDSSGEYFMLYFDERGVSRKFEVTMHGNTWKTRRIVPGCSQRFAGTVAEDGKTMIGTSELSTDGSSWEKDRELRYERIE